MTSFAPLIGEQPHTLVLGSMPSRISLQQTQYYAHPRNAFWWIMGELIGFDHRQAYNDRVNSLLQSRVAVWDVLLDCQREGSLDSNIQRASEQVNDFPSFFRDNPSIKLIAFNGAASKTIFMRHCKAVLDQFPGLTTVLLPSTSPAHASMNKYEKLQLWRKQLPQLSKTLAADNV